jgi:hypothetical protein
MGLERYNVANNIWTAVGSMLEGRKWFAAVVLDKPAEGAVEVLDFFDSLIATALQREDVGRREEVGRREDFARRPIGHEVLQSVSLGFAN